MTGEEGCKQRQRQLEREGAGAEGGRGGGLLIESTGGVYGREKAIINAI